MELIIGIVATVIGSIVGWQVKKWIEHRQDQEIKLQKAPRNFLEHIGPGISVDQAKEILGVPYRNRQNQLTFKFSNALIEIRSKENSISTITLLLNDLSKANTFKIPRIDKTLGIVTLNDIIAYGEELNRETSSKHGKIWTECYFGYPGLYQYYTFGIFGGPVGAFNNKFPAENELKDETTLNLKANYISISNKSGEGAHFDFWAMV